MQWKYAPIALLVSLLSACGGSSGSGDNVNPGPDEETEITEPDTGTDPDITPGVDTRTIKVIDGYLQGAVIFDDLDTNGLWDEEEPLLGITDHNGDAQIANDYTFTQLAALTVVQGSELSKRLALANSDYSGFSTVDADAGSGTVFGSEIVLWSHNDSAFITPYTHLSTTCMYQNQGTKSECDNWVATTVEQLNHNPSYVDDYIANTDKSGSNLENDSFLQWALARSLVLAMASEGQEQPTDLLQLFEDGVDLINAQSEYDLIQGLLPILVGNDASTTNYPTVTNPRVFEQLSASLYPATAFELGDKQVRIELPLFDEEGEALFSDPDNATSTEVTIGRTYTGSNNKSIYFGARENTYGDEQPDIEISITEDNRYLVIESADVAVAGNFHFYLRAWDVDVLGNNRLGPVLFIKMFIPSDNSQPEVSQQVLDELQSALSNVELIQWRSFYNHLPINELFTDPDGDPISYEVRSSGEYNGLKANIVGSGIAISGRPKRATESDKQHRLILTAYDNKHLEGVDVELTWPEVNASAGEPQSAHELEDAIWYKRGVRTVRESNSTADQIPSCSIEAYMGGNVYRTWTQSDTTSGCQDEPLDSNAFFNYGPYSIDEEGNLTYSYLFYTTTHRIAYKQTTPYGDAYAIGGGNTLTMFYSDPRDVTDNWQLTFLMPTSRTSGFYIGDYIMVDDMSQLSGERWGSKSIETMMPDASGNYFPVTATLRFEPHTQYLNVATFKVEFTKSSGNLMSCEELTAGSGPLQLNVNLGAWTYQDEGYSCYDEDEEGNRVAPYLRNQYYFSLRYRHEDHYTVTVKPSSSHGDEAERFAIASLVFNANVYLYDDEAD